jgi:hypothetical protein
MTSRLMRRLDALAEISAEPDRLTRVYLSPEHARAHVPVGAWHCRRSPRAAPCPVSVFFSTPRPRCS